MKNKILSRFCRFTFLTLSFKSVKFKIEKKDEKFNDNENNNKSSGPGPIFF